jgi:hypothetical protein
VDVSPLRARLQRRLARARTRLTAAAVARGLLVTLAVVGSALLLALVVEAATWLGVGLRTAIAWGLGALLASLVLALVVPPLLRALGWLPGLDDHSVARRADADHPGAGDRLTAFLDLSDGHGSGGPDRLRTAALAALGADLEEIPFERVRVRDTFRRALPFAVAPVALLAGLFVGAPGTMTGAAERLLSPTVFFAPPAPFAFQVEPGDTELVRGEALAVRALAVGAELPVRARLEFGRADERATESVALGRGRDGAFAHTVEDVRATLRYRFVADGVRTRWFTAEITNRPVIRGLRVTVAPPAYSGRRAVTLPEGVGDATGLAGSAVRVQVGLGGAKPAAAWIAVRWEDGRTSRVPMRLGSEGALGQFALRGAGAYTVHLRTASGLENADPARYTLGVLADGPPQIVLTEGAEGDLTADARRLAFRVSDDFGFSGGSLVWRVVEGPTASRTVRRSALPVRTRPLDQDVAVRWRIPGAQPGDVVEFYGEVRDNDAARGRKSARTPVYRLRFATVADQLDEIGAQRDSTMETLQTVERQAERSRERFERLRESLRENPNPDWEDQRQVQQLRQEQSDLQQQAQQLQEQMQQLTEQLRQSGLLDEQTQRMMDQMRQVMQDLEAPEMREALRRLQEAMERLDLREMLESADQAEQRQEDFQERLERALELMRRLEAAVEMQEAARRADDLAEREEQLARDTEALQERADEPPRRDDPATPQREDSPAAERERLAEEQARAREDAEALREQLEELREQLESMPNAPQEATEQMLEQMQQEGGLPEQMQQNEQQLRQNQLEPAQQGQQEMARQLRRMSQQMREQSAQMQGRQRQVDTAALRRALEDVLTLSREQESLAAQTQNTPARSAAVVPLARRQRDIQDGLRTVADTLRRVARSVPQLGVEVQTRTQNASREVALALEQLADRQAGRAVANQRTAMSHLNELALLLADVLEQMQNQQQQSGSGSGQQGTPQQLQQMGEQQSRLNQQIQQMLNQSAGQRLSREQGQRLRQLAEQQEAIRRQLQQLLRQGGAGGEDGLDPAGRSALQRIEEQMRDAARELRRGQLDTRAAPRQDQILQRLLQTERSINERGREEQRQGQTGAPRPDPERPSSLPAQPRPADLVRADLIRALESGYSADYQDLIKRYFERLQGRFSE